MLSINGDSVDHLQRALNCDTSVFIQACAGAGKTFALTKRYAAILDSFAREAEAGAGAAADQIDHKRILVITFTKKATGEMNRRIYEDVNILLSGKEIKEFKGKNFCPTLRTSRHEAVKKFTQDLKDTFPQNSISTIDSFCAGILREFSYKAGLDPQFKAQDEHDTKRLLNEMLSAWVSEKLNSDPGYFNRLLDEFSFYQIKEILKSMYASREILDDYINDFEHKSGEQIWREWLAHYTPDADIENLAATFESLWKRIPSLCGNKEDALYKGVQKMQADLCGLDRHDPLEFRAAFISDVVRNGVFFTKSGTYLRKNTGSKGNWSDNKDQVMGWFQLLKDTLDEKDILMVPGLQDKKIIPFLKDLIKKFREFDAYFSAIRMDRDLLDFSDVIILTHKLLSEHKDVRKILGQRYRHIMLDEFQDTNPLRWQIIRMILDAGNDIKLFIVGDRKQSIYRFNNADVTVMDTAEEVIRSLKGEIIEFNDNYRSSQTLIDEAINPLMSMILKKPGEEKEAYEADFRNTESPQKKEGLEGGTLERIWCGHAKDEEEYIPAYHTAYQVKRLLAGHENTGIDKEKEKPLIAVLLRRGTKISDYLQAFHKFGVPVSILGGKDFYSSPALNDIYYFISVLDNPLDDHAMTGLLRSPFLALPDPRIHLLADRGNRPIFDAMASIPELRQAYLEIVTWRELSKTLALDELLAHILDSDDRELGYVSELMPEQQLANLDKALNLIRGLQRGGSSLREIREFLHYQIRTGADEPQAICPAQARVQILTVHKAKGLEFPIVVIPEMNSKGNTDKDRFRYGRSDGRPEISLSLSDDEKPGMLTRLKEIAKKEEEAEDKRVFYVAVTRAIHKVVLLGEGEKAAANSWWTKYVLGIPEDPDKQELLAENWGENVEILPKEKVIPKNMTSETDALPWKEKTQYEGPGKYLYRSPHDLMGEGDEVNVNDEKSGLGAAPGSLFHYCMEQGWLDADKYQQDINAHSSHTYPELNAQELFEKLKPWLRNIKGHELSAVLLDPDVEKYPEHKIKAWLGNDLDIVQVNGSIDLLYRQDGRWLVLDYKTDASKRLLSRYKKQLQSYQWMLKQAYGIDAAAKIFFVSLNDVEDVAWDEDYFNELPLGLSLKPQLPHSSMDISNLVPEIKDGKQLILCASAQHEEQVYLALARKGLLRPDIRISTLSKFLHEKNENGISQDKLRLMIRHRNPGMKNGTADLLAKALRDEELLKGKIRNDFRTYYGNITSLPAYRSAAEPYHRVKADGQRIILLDVYEETDLDKALINRLASETDLVRLSLSHDHTEKNYTLLESFSPREEVLACAKHIRDNYKKDEQVLIAVASMEKYAPHLQRQFPKVGLRTRFIGPRALYELPCTAQLMNYLKLCTKGAPEWNDLTSVVLHPLMNAEGRLFEHDRKVRQEPMNERAIPETGLHLCRKSSDVLKCITDVAGELKKDNDTETCKACDKFLEIVEKVISDLTEIDPQTDISAIYREMSERVKKESIQRRDQFNGIPVVGLLDSLGVRADKLYILGMVEGDIPRQEKDNPFFTKNKDHSLELNRHFMDEWLKLGERAIFCTSTHAEDGSEQNRSSFLEDIKMDVFNKPSAGRREELLAYAGKNITGTAFPLIERHHEILGKRRNKYSGDIDVKQSIFNVSVTQVDKLLACPMRFYFDTVLKCAPMDQDETLYWGSKRGNVIHKAFEYFIGRNGYELELQGALTLMDDCLKKALAEENIDTGDPLQMDQFRNYIKDLTEGSDKNCIAINLSLIKKDYDPYQCIESEKDFKDFRLEYPGLLVMLRGRIDKIMIDEKEKKLIASDFKTGNLSVPRLSKMMLSQLYLYLRYCAEAYPGYERKAIYERLKDPKNCKILQFEIDGDEFKQSNGNHSFVIEDFEEHLRDLFTQISGGRYYITDRPYSDACENCQHAGLCRKDARLKIGN